MTELFSRRVYTYNGISVVVDIDFVKKTLSLVDKSGKQKPWVFTGRTLEYMEGWQAIFDAQKYAVKEATKVLQALSERDQEEFIQLMAALTKMRLDKK